MAEIAEITLEQSVSEHLILLKNIKHTFTQYNQTRLFHHIAFTHSFVAKDKLHLLNIKTILFVFLTFFFCILSKTKSTNCMIRQQIKKIEIMKQKIAGNIT